MVYLGTDLDSRETVALTPEARRQGVYVIGTTGTGKTTLLKSIAVQDMNDPARPGLCVLDPHGDMTDELLALVPKERAPHVILFAPGEKKEQYDHPLGLNILACNREDPHERELVSSTVVGTLKRLFAYSWGPRMEDLLRNGVLTLMEREGATLLDLWILLADEALSELGVGGVRDPFLWRFWNMFFAGFKDYEKTEIVSSALNKIGRFLGNPIIRNIVGQPVSAVDMDTVLNSTEGKILLVNLSKGDLGEDNSALLGSVLVNLILIAALRRRNTLPEARRPFHLIVDEYQSFATESFPILQSEARKYGITVIVAHQYRDQLDELNKGSTLNVANFICLRVSGRDSLELASQFDNTPPEPDTSMRPLYRQIRTDNGRPVYAEVKSPTGTGRQFHEVELPQRLYADVAAERANVLSILPNYQALCRLLIDRDLVEHRIALSPVDRQEPSKQEQRKRREIADFIRTNSLQLGRDRQQVERDIKERFFQTSFAHQLPPER